MNTPMPDSCTICRRSPLGIAVGSHEQPKWLCAECITLVKEIRALRSLDPYEEVAVDECVDKIGDWLGDINKTDLAEFNADEQRLLVTIAVRAFGDSLRRQIKEGAAPF